ncbi:MAG: hypothetical protein U0547_12240 [Dehalococcoidia bacterium]|nr:hypothetical protein [Dehalococcoidia bacterium]
MLAILPFLMSANDAGVICLVIFLASNIIFGIPVLSTRGTTQLMWAGIVGFVLFVEVVAMITFVALISNGTISPSFS